MQGQHNLEFKPNISTFILQILELPIHTFTGRIPHKIHYNSLQGSSLGCQVPAGLSEGDHFILQCCDRRKPPLTSLKESILYLLLDASKPNCQCLWGYVSI